MAEDHNIVIRRAAERDLPAIQKLYAEAGLDGGKPLPLQEATDIFVRMSRYPSYRLWIAEQDGGAVGTYALVILDNIAHSGRPLAVVEQVAVDESLRGRGIGKRMMVHAMDEARAAGCYKLMLSSHVDRVDAHGFYDKLGFTRHGYGFVISLADEGADQAP